MKKRICIVWLAGLLALTGCNGREATGQATEWETTAAETVTGMNDAERAGESAADAAEEPDWSRKILNLEMADVTHDGKKDYIVTMIMLPPGVDVNSENIDELLYGAGEGYVQVYDGNAAFNPAGFSTAKPVWEEGFAAAVPGHVQISLVHREGLDYLLISHIDAEMGTYAFSYRVVSLDEEGKESVVDSEAFSFDNVDRATYEQKPVSTEQKQQIRMFKERISTWFEGATLLAGIEDVNMVTTPAQRYTPEQFYDTIWPKYLEQ